MFVVYIIYSEKTDRYYIGYTSDLAQRLEVHNQGKNKSTKSGVPWKLILSETHMTKKEAWLREHQIKKYKGGEAFKKLLNL